MAAAIYASGWLLLRRRDARHWNGWQPSAFLGGLFTIYLALASPIEAFAPFLLQVHMLQHLLLMMVAPPLLWLGAPMFPLLRGLPSEVRRYWIAPLFHWRPLRRIASVLTHPAAALMIFVTITWLWHLPSTYNSALADDTLHKLQHICFLTAGLLFWYPVVRPYPGRPRWSPWWLVPFLLLADVQNTLLSAWLTFSDSVLYAHYSSMPRLGGLTALDDQAAAGVLMWVPGSVAFLLPLVWIGVRLVQGRQTAVGRRTAEGGRKSPAHPLTRSPVHAATPHSPLGIPHFDLLRLSLIGPILRSNWTRRVVQFAVYCRYRRRHRWPRRAANRADEFGWRGAVDSLALAGRVRFAHRGQCFLLRLPVYVAAHCRAVLLGIVCAKGVAKMAANKVAGRRIAGRVFMVLRSVFALESAVVDGLDRDLLFRRRW